ncbi:GtrA family protein [Pseudomonas paracarnis]|uniref:Bactoprenol-linked glucose translocase n=1 Tax=Pseudomonas paracarnis TaxID=2750625 RepID=A0ABU6BUA0_9PSED|nr:GtrA family protein [Pseudomonas paracarnis]MBW9244080.1 GtrA family protein [Pseudomonas paracarnis]MEB3783757.1 GtrA family protein [Pseudomonas paracarnis]
MIKLFSRYLSVGVLNTAVHWAVFFSVYYMFGLSQSISNLCAFCVAVTFSFVMNAKFTFKQKATSRKYAAYVAFMGVLSVLVGSVSDALHAAPIITILFFSAVSLGVGFLYSRYVVFR